LRTGSTFAEPVQANVLVRGATAVDGAPVSRKPKRMLALMAGAALVDCLNVLVARVIRHDQDSGRAGVEDLAIAGFSLPAIEGDAESIGQRIWLIASAAQPRETQGLVYQRHKGSKATPREHRLDEQEACGKTPHFANRAGL
jgi:hypothetical protein